MPYQLREGIRGASRSIVNAINTPERLRLAAKQEANYDEDRAAKKLREVADAAQKNRDLAEKQTKQWHKEGLAQNIEQGKMLAPGGKSLSPEVMSGMIRGGYDPSDIGSLTKALIPTPKEPKDHAEDTSMRFFEGLSAAAQQQFAAEAENIDLNNPDELSKLNDLYGAYKKQSDYFTAAMAGSKKPEYGALLVLKSDRVMAGMNQKTLDLTAQTLKRTMENMGGEVRRYSDVLESGEHEFAKTNRLNGTISERDMKAFKMSIKARKSVPDDLIAAIDNVRDPQNLIDTIEGKGNEDLKLYALMMLKVSMQSKIVGANVDIVKTEAKRPKTLLEELSQNIKGGRKFEPDVKVDKGKQKKSLSGTINRLQKFKKVKTGR